MKRILSLLESLSVPLVSFLPLFWLYFFRYQCFITWFLVKNTNRKRNIFVVYTVYNSAFIFIMQEPWERFFNSVYTNTWSKQRNSTYFFFICICLLMFFFCYRRVCPSYLFTTVFFFCSILKKNVLLLSKWVAVIVVTEEDLKNRKVKKESKWRFNSNWKKKKWNGHISYFFSRANILTFLLFFNIFYMHFLNTIWKRMQFYCSLRMFFLSILLYFF